MSEGDTRVPAVPLNCPDEEELEGKSKDELLAWIKKGGGKGTKGPGTKGNKGGFQGNCLYCGAWGHRLNECRKKDSDMKGKGKGQNQSSFSNWGPPNPFKGKGKGQTGPWNPGKGSGGKGKGAYSVEDDWSAGNSGYHFGYEDTPLWLHDFAAEAAEAWQTPNPRKTTKPTLLVEGVSRACRHPQVPMPQIP